MATFKQYLQNRWYRWMSQDRTVAYPYQFQYWRNVNVRNEKWWVMLSSRPILYSTTTWPYAWVIQIAPAGSVYWSSDPEYTQSYCLTYDSWTDVCSLREWMLAKLWDTTALSQPLLNCQSWLRTSWQDQYINVPFWPRIKTFRDWVFVVNGSPATLYFRWDSNGTDQPWINVMSLVAELADWQTYWTDFIVHAVYNYADTFFLVAIWWVLLRFQPLTDNYTDLANWKIIRYFGVWKNIVWLSQSWNYLKIYVTDWVTTECHYAQWTFDLEESGLVQTCKFEWRLIEDCLVSDWIKDYWLFKTNIWIRLLEIDWYSYNVIRETERRWVENWTDEQAHKIEELIFHDKPNNHWHYASKLVWYNWVLYCSLAYDGIWTFTKESVWSHWWAWWWVVEWWEELWRDWQAVTAPCIQMSIQWWILMWLSLNPFISPWGLAYLNMFKMEINDYPNMYSWEWYIIWNVYDWGVWSSFKKNVSTTLVCGNSMPRTSVNWLLWLCYRYDRVNNALIHYRDYWMSPIKMIETSWIYDTIFITSIQNDLTNISAQEIGAEPEKFNRPRNTIEYIIQLNCPLDANWNQELFVSPILYEHNLIYEDTMRKYR